MATFFIASLLIVILLLCWALTLLGMPGNWLMILAAGVYSFFVPADSPAAIGWNTIAVLVVLAGLGEVIEFAAGAAGTAKAGGSKRGAILALAGSIVGGIFGIFAGLPIPIFGSLLAAILFACLGAMVGAVLGEVWAGKNIDASLEIGKAAFIGRLLGTLGKMLVGAVMVAVVLAGLIL